jgi:hypothetical protein
MLHFSCLPPPLAPPGGRFIGFNPELGLPEPELKSALCLMVIHLLNSLACCAHANLIITITL